MQLPINELSKINLFPEATLEQMIASTTIRIGIITFSNEDLLLRDLEHNNALYLTVTCIQKHIPLTLVDNRSAVNVCPRKTTKRLGIKESQLSTPLTHLRAYDNSKILVLGTILPSINVGHVGRNMEFQSLDNLNSFTLLPGQPWLHEHQVVPSTLHKKVKMLIKR